MSISAKLSTTSPVATSVVVLSQIVVTLVETLCLKKFKEKEEDEEHLLIKLIKIAAARIASRTVGFIFIMIAFSPDCLCKDSLSVAF